MIESRPTITRFLVAAFAALTMILAPVPVASQTAAAAEGIEIDLDVSWHEFRHREAVRLTGKVTKNGKAVKRTTVKLYREDLKNGKSGRVATARTTSSGRFAIWLSPSNDTLYSARVGSARSDEIRVDRTVGERTLDDRERTLGSRIGAEKSKVKRLSKSSRRGLGISSIDTIRYREHTRGLLVEVTQGARVRTWLVTGKIRTAYEKAGGPRGKYGVPLGDARCGLMEGGCLQRFSGGALYSKKSKSRAYGQTGNSRVSMVVAVARSQVGYAEPSFRNSKYNRWTDSVNSPWCSAFQSWVVAAAGRSDLLPKRARLWQLVRDIKKDDDVTIFKPSSRKHKPKLGTLAFYDYRYGGDGKDPSHMGLILKVKKNTLVTLEGNTSKAGGFGNKRGVYIRERPKSRVVFYANPDY
ncbi:MAG: hypothetical protein GX593_02120 [Actinomycetales bacterium]|nr:hypothetical protein [Actinomycetales bacterium]